MNRDILKKVNAYYVLEARDDFWVYRQYINPKLKLSWWQKEVAYELMRFWEDFKLGKRPKLAIEAPPQHGKSQMIIDFISWIAGKDPDKKTIYTSYSERLGIRANLRLQRIFDSDKFKRVFPDTKINTQNTVTVSGQYLRNREILEYVDHDGYFRNVTCGGSITGDSLDMCVCDDLVKGRQEALSEAVRQRTEDWIDDDLRTRFSDEAAWLIIGTRWLLDDAIGYIRKRFTDIKVLTYKAIAEHDEKHRKEGEALFPNHKSIEFLLEQKKTRSAYSWLALYQQNPTMENGNLFNRETFKYFTYEDGYITTDKKLLYSNYRIFQTIDTAGTEKKKSDYFVVMTFGVNIHNKDIIILDIRREKAETPKHRELLDTEYAKWNPVMQYVENKSFGINLIQSYALSARPLGTLDADTNKIMRTTIIREAFYDHGKVWHRQGAPWLADFEKELLEFPFGSHDDMVDCIAYAGILMDKLPITPPKISAGRGLN